MTESIREQRGRLVRETWVTWAREQPDPKDSWLTSWEDLDEGQREVDMRIGDALAAAERERIRLVMLRASKSPTWAAIISGADALRQFAAVLGGGS